jgi:hypothetical protein
MPSALTWLDRLRIARTIWTLNAKIVDLPTNRRKEIRRELRANLRVASGEVGSREAVRQLGDLRRLAGDYLDAEYGEDGRRPRYVTGLLWAVAVELGYMAAVVLWLEGFTAGAETVKPHPDGTFSAGGGFWLPQVGVTFEGGQVNGWDFQVPVLSFFLFPTLAFMLGARIWRWLPPWLRQRRQRKHARQPA